MNTKEQSDVKGPGVTTATDMLRSCRYEYATEVMLTSFRESFSWAKRESDRGKEPREERKHQREKHQTPVHVIHIHAGVFVCYDVVTGEAHSITSHNHTWLAAGILCFVIRQISAGRATWNLVESLTLAHERGKYYISGSTSCLNTFGHLGSVSTNAFFQHVFSIVFDRSATYLKTVAAWRSAKRLFLFFWLPRVKKC